MAHAVVEKYTRISTHHGDPMQGSRFGKHLGTDFACPTGTPVKAPVSGRVVSVSTGAVGGLTIEIYGDDGHNWRILHLSQSDVKANQRVTEGQLIARSGNTGQTTGPHAHVDCRKGGTRWDASFDNYFDPELLFKEHTSHPETVSVGTWNVRTAPNINASKRDGVVLGGQRYDTVIVDGGWRKISFRGADGYVGPAAWR